MNSMHVLTWQRDAEAIHLWDAIITMTKNITGFKGATSSLRGPLCRFTGSKSKAPRMQCCCVLSRLEEKERERETKTRKGGTNHWKGTPTEWRSIGLTSGLPSTVNRRHQPQSTSVYDSECVHIWVHAWDVNKGCRPGTSSKTSCTFAFISTWRRNLCAKTCWLSLE
jgi:hypothetical protein